MMNREIKFRAFDPVKKEMWFNQFCITSSGNVQKSEISREWHSWKNEDFILMQFTGLRDKNGVPIFEGDVLRTSSAAGKDGFMYGIIEFRANQKDGAGFTWRNCDIGSYKAINSDIVGNIYEHPQLLEKVDEND